MQEEYRSLSSSSVVISITLLALLCGASRFCPCCSRSRSETPTLLSALPLACGQSWHVLRRAVGSGIVPCAQLGYDDLLGVVGGHLVWLHFVLPGVSQVYLLLLLLTCFPTSDYIANLTHYSDFWMLSQ